MNYTRIASIVLSWCALVALMAGSSPRTAQAIALPPQTNLTEWFRADAVPGAANGSAVTTWADQALSNGAQNGAAAGTTPTFVLNSANGLPALDFNGTGGSYVTSGSPGILAGSVYVMVVATDSFTNGGVGDGAGTYYVDRNPGGNPLMGLKAASGTFGLQKRDNAGGGLGGPLATSPIDTSGKYQIVTWRRNVGASQFEIYVNGALQGTAVDPLTVLIPDAPVIGNHVGGAAGTSLNGRIAEFLVYNDSLSASDLTGVHTYLQTKYQGLPYQAIPGLFNTGVNNAGAPLPDGIGDSHFVLNVNPDATGSTPIVENSTLFPIVAGPWVANSATSKWIGPRLETSGSAAGNYEYTLTFSLDGLDPSTAYLSGQWATDNAGVALLLNGVPTGLVNTTEFGAFTPFLITSGFVGGANTLTFRVNNAAVGYTGLRVENLQGFAQVTIPEPATATLGLIALSFVGLRRRRAA